MNKRKWIRYKNRYRVTKKENDILKSLLERTYYEKA